MLINGVDISNYHAELLDRAISTASVRSVTDWLDGAAVGSLLRQKRDWHNLKLTFLIREPNEDLAYKRVSVLNEVLKKCQLRFDDIQLDFACVLEGTTIPERLQNGVFKVAFTLKNYHATEDEVKLSYSLAAINAKKIKVVYYRSWADTMGNYVGCFDQNEIFEKLAEDEYYIDMNTLDVKAQGLTSWTTLFLNLGVDINKYKQINEQHGFVNVGEDYDATKVVTLFERNDTFVVYYNRIRMDGFPDLPYNKTYPSLAWRAPAGNRYYFYTDVGAGWNVNDITVRVIGRYFDTSTNSNGGMFGADKKYGLYTTGSKAYFLTGDGQHDAGYSFPVYSEDSSSGGGGIVIVKTSFEDISSMPMREHGIKTANEGSSPIVGYANVKFNGSTLSQVATTDAVLTDNITIGRSYNTSSDSFVIGKNMDIARVQIYYKGELKRDYIPIASNLKNGFYNTYDTAMYDIVGMKFLPWIHENGSTGTNPGSGLMPIPEQITPTPDVPVTSSYYVIVSNGTGTGSYEPGSLITVAANPAPTGKEFDKWEITGILVTDNTSQTFTFYMPNNNVVLRAIYKDSGSTPEPTTYYDVLVTNGSGTGTYQPGKLIILKANEAPTNYVFSGWTLTGVSVTDAGNSTISFYMPSNNVTAVANYTASTTPEPVGETHLLTVNDGMGGGRYYNGDSVTVTANYIADKQFKKWDASGITLYDATQSTITFYMPNNDVTLTAVYEDTSVITVTGGWYIYWTPAGSPGSNYNTERKMGENAISDNPRAMGFNSNYYYAFVFKQPNVTPVDISYYSNQKMTLGASTRDKWNRFVIPWTPNSVTGASNQYIQGTVNQKQYKLTFRLDSALD